MMFSTISSAYKTICPVWSSLYLNGATSISYSVFFQVQRWEHIVDGSLKYKISPCDPSDWIPVLNEGHAEQSGGCELNMRMKRRIFSKRQNVYGLVMKIISKDAYIAALLITRLGILKLFPFILWLYKMPSKPQLLGEALWAWACLTPPPKVRWSEILSVALKD